MDGDDPIVFRVILGVLLAGLLLLRLVHHVRAGTFRESWHPPREGKLALVLKLLILAWGGCILVYVIYPPALHWARVWNSQEWLYWLRWLGAGLGLADAAWFIWVHHTLGKNFSPTLRIRQDHKLVTDGPYRWVRHPMYTGGMVAAAVAYLLSANWVIGLGGISLIVFALIRVPQEEALMIAQFGNDYRKYMQRTNRFWPRLNRFR